MCAAIALGVQGYSHAQSASQGTAVDYSKGGYTVQMYDADTIALLNQPRPAQSQTQVSPAQTMPVQRAQPQTQAQPVQSQPVQSQPVQSQQRVYGGSETSQPSEPARMTSGAPATSAPVSQQAPVAAPAKPRFPIDISAQYTGIDEGVPFIDTPKNCAGNLLDIKVRVENVAKTKGIIVADLHNDVVEDFLVWDKVVLRVTAPATEGFVEFCMPLKQPGDYAVVIYHDKDSDREFDKNFLGIPSEHFGMSQNPKFGLRSPDYDEAAFTVPETGASITIKLRKASDVL